MDTMSAYLRGKAARAAGARSRVFDWERAAKIIVEKGAREADAGLSEDWSYTRGQILANGMPVAERDYHDLASLWATPTLEIDGEHIECWRYEEDAPGWNAETFWPESAKAILSLDLKRGDHDEHKG